MKTEDQCCVITDNKETDNKELFVKPFQFPPLSNRELSFSLIVLFSQNEKLIILLSSIITLLIITGSVFSLDY